MSAYQDVEQGKLIDPEEPVYEYEIQEEGAVREWILTDEKPAQYDYDREVVVMKEAPRSVGLKQELLQVHKLEDEIETYGDDIIDNDPQELRRAVILSEILQRKF
ncbi:MAG: hypothetical protein Q4A53_01500 [Porphyromonas sp.]|nr:hypothetical protein [Porphyromonas sp.]